MESGDESKIPSSKAVDSAAQEQYTDSVVVNKQKTPASVPLNRWFPSQLQSVSEVAFSFLDSEIKEGVVVERGSPADEVWTLLSQNGPSVFHPDSANKKAPTIESMARRARYACDREIELHATYLAIVDRVKTIDEKNAEGVHVDMNRRGLVLQSSSVFDEWCLARSRCERYMNCYHIFERDRMDRVVKALVILSKPSFKNGSFADGVWVPNTNFVEKLKYHLAELRLGLQMSKYYQVQNCVALVTGRPLFSPSELDSSLRLAYERDPMTKSPISGSIGELMRLSAVAI